MSLNAGIHFAKLKPGAALTAQNLVSLPDLDKIAVSYGVTYLRESAHQTVLMVKPVGQSNDYPGLISIVEDGKLNPSFGGGSGVFSPLAYRPDYPPLYPVSFEDLAIQPQGGSLTEEKILLLTQSTPGLLVRLNADGSRDSKFGTGEDLGYYGSLNGRWMVPSLDGSQAEVISLQNGPSDYDATWFSIDKIQL
jgi:hypothetical protein